MSIRALPRDPSTGEWQWPFAEKNLAMESPIATALINEVEMTASIRSWQSLWGNDQRLDSYLSDLEAQIRETASDQISKL